MLLDPFMRGSTVLSPLCILAPHLEPQVLLPLSLSLVSSSLVSTPSLIFFSVFSLYFLCARFRWETKLTPSISTFFSSPNSFDKAEFGKSLVLILTSTKSGWAATAQLRDTMTSHDTTRLQHHDTATPRYHNTTTPQLYDTTTLRHHDMATQRQHDSTTSQHHDITTQTPQI